MRISDWSSDVCSSDLPRAILDRQAVIGPEPQPPLVAIDLDQRLREQLVVHRGGIAAIDHAGRTAGMAEQDRRDILAANRRVDALRSEERRVGKEGVSTCRSRWSPYH